MKEEIFIKGNRVLCNVPDSLYELDQGKTSD